MEFVLFGAQPIDRDTSQLAGGDHHVFGVKRLVGWDAGLPG